MKKLVRAFVGICILSSFSAVFLLHQSSWLQRRTKNNNERDIAKETEAEVQDFDIPDTNLSDQIRVGHSPEGTQQRNVTLSTAELSEIYRKRTLHLEKVCERVKHLKLPRHMAGPTLLFNKRLRVLYCAIGKVATSSWQRVLIESTGRFHGDDERLSALPHHLQGQRITRRLLGRLKPPFNYMDINSRHRRYFKFLFVRHPFERLVSAFVSKFHDRNDNTYVSTYGRRIISMYRHNASQRSLRRGRDVRFPEFVRYIVEKNRTRRRDDFHWRPMLEACLPCRINYTYVGHYETLGADAAHVLRTLGVAGRVQFPEVREKKLRRSEELTRTMFSHVPLADVERLRGLYREDFELFGYDPYQYGVR